jgi:hypothetical protein
MSFIIVHHGHMSFIIVGHVLFGIQAMKKVVFIPGVLGARKRITNGRGGECVECVVKFGSCLVWRAGRARGGVHSRGTGGKKAHF